MESKKNKVGRIKRFFMWLFLGINKNIETIEISETESEPIPTHFGSNESEEKHILSLKKELERRKQNLSKKYNPNVRRGESGRYESLKK